MADTALTPWAHIDNDDPLLLQPPLSAFLLKRYQQNGASVPQGIPRRPLRPSRWVESGSLPLPPVTAMLELDALLAPISDAVPCGEDLSFAIEFDAIQEARREDDASLAQGEWVTDLKVADWTGVAAACDALLRTRSKDLRVAGWLAEARTRIHGFGGLADGYRLVGALCDAYWDELHPLIEDDDLEQRIGTISWLLVHSANWLRQLPVVQGPQGRFTLGDFDAARARGDGGGDLPGLDTMEAARRDTPHAFYVGLVQQVSDCSAALDGLQTAVDRRLGRDGPSFSPLRDQLELLHVVVRRFARDAGVLMDGDAPTGDESSVATDPALPAPSRGDGSVNSRREALVQLRRVAEFFRRTEPHSPVAYLADKAANWGEMPLHVWLKRVIKDDATLLSVEELLDISDNAAGSSAADG